VSLFWIDLKFIKKLFGKKEDVPTRISLKFGDLPGWLEAESEKRFSKLQPHIRQKYGEIGAALENLNTGKERLEAAMPVDEAVYKRIAKAGASNRDNLVKNLNIIIEKTVVPEDITASGASVFYTSARSTFKTSIENTIRSQQYVKTLYPGEYREIMDELSHLDTLLDELITPVNEVRDELDVYDRLSGTVETINNTKQQIREKEKKILDLERVYGSSKDDLRTGESELEQLEEGPDFVRAQELEEQVRILGEKISGIDFNVRAIFTPLSKAMLRMEKQDESGRHLLSPGSRDILGRLKEDPISVMGTDITPFLNEIRNRVKDGTLGLKQQKKNKTLEQIDKLTGSDILSPLYNQRKSYSAELARVLEELDGLTVYNERKRLKNQISGYQDMITSTEQDLELERKHLIRLRDEAETSMTELSSDIRHVFGNGIEVIHS